jgi:hypothetical protein
MRPLLLLLVLVLGSGSIADAAVTHGTYTGSAKTNVKYLDPNTLQTVATGSYGRKMKVKIGPRKQIRSATEANPFTMVISPSEREESPVAGELFAASARVFKFNGSDVLLQYWTLQNTSSGFRGALTDKHSAKGRWSNAWSPCWAVQAGSREPSSCTTPASAQGSSASSPRQQAGAT